jgi:membrane fusion protein, heavy metal efflux system
MRFAVFILIAMLFAATAWTTGGRAHEGQDHAPPSAAAPPAGMPRLAINSETYQLVAVLDQQRLTIYLDRYTDNAPVTGATINVAIDGEFVTAEATSEGTYGLASSRFGGHGAVELIFDIKAPDADDLLIGNLSLAAEQAAHLPANSSSPYWQSVSVLQHTLEDHFLLLTIVLFTGTVLGFSLSRRRKRVAAVVIIGLASSAMMLATPEADAHDDHDHGDNAKALLTPGDTARRLPNGQIFVPKPMQRILDVRTVVATPRTVAKTASLVGRIIADPSRSGLVQSINGGRVFAPDQGLALLGQAVAKGHILATIEPPMPIADRTTIAERAGELEQMIAVGEAKLRRLRPLGARGVIAQGQIVDAEAELEGLYRRRDVVRESRTAPEVLRAPIDGVIAIARVVAGQVVQAQDVLFQVVDPESLWVEAFDYGDTDPTTLKHATAAAAAHQPMALSFRGWSRTLQQQATVVQFSITDPPASLRVGQPVTVTAERNESSIGMIVSRSAVVRGGNGETMVVRHVEPEIFEPRLVRIEPVDAASVMIAAGISDGDRIVIRGADLISQIR